MRERPDVFRDKVSSPERWWFTLEPGFGSFAHDAAKLVDAKAGSEEEALLLASVEGCPPDFIMRLSENGSASIKDVKSNAVIWMSEKNLNS